MARSLFALSIVLLALSLVASIGMVTVSFPWSADESFKVVSEELLQPTDRLTAKKTVAQCRKAEDW
jgi:hypothetical protein